MLKLGKTGRHNESSANGQAPEEADGCKGVSSGSPLPMEFHSSSIIASSYPIIDPYWELSEYLLLMLSISQQINGNNPGLLIEIPRL